MKRRHKYVVLFQLFFLQVTLLLITITSLAQTKTVTGTVRDDKGQPLSGASVKVKETSAGANTDAEGKFKISVAETGTLVITYVGYKPEEIPVRGRSTIDIQLKGGSDALGEVIIVAYGSTTKKTTTGAIQTINARELKDIPVAQITQKLQGKFAGVQISQTTGKPGQGMSVKIRGQVSILAGSDPLYVVDGFPITGDISNINPDEIENISVLKDAASTSLYGFKGGQWRSAYYYPSCQTRTKQCWRKCLVWYSNGAPKRPARYDECHRVCAV